MEQTYKVTCGIGECQSDASIERVTEIISNHIKYDWPCRTALAVTPNQPTTRKFSVTFDNLTKKDLTASEVSKLDFETVNDIVRWG